MSTCDLDASYKEAKKLVRCNVRPVFKGYITALNQVGGMILALHVNSEPHDQMRATFEAFKHTTSEYGLPPLELYFSNNAKGDMRFIEEIFPSLQAKQEEFNALNPSTLTASKLPKVSIQVSKCVFFVCGG